MAETTATPSAPKAAKAKAPKARKASTKGQYLNESGADKFKRVGTRRLQAAVKQIRGLTNVAKGAAYDVTKDGAAAVMGYLDAAVNELRETLVRRVNGKRAVEDIRL